MDDKNYSKSNRQKYSGNTSSKTSIYTCT